jgi:hypothetical protein
VKVNIPGVERLKGFLPTVAAAVIVVCCLGVFVGWLGWALVMARNYPSV